MAIWKSKEHQNPDKYRLGKLKTLVIFRSETNHPMTEVEEWFEDQGIVLCCIDGFGETERGNEAERENENENER
jgi:hypothetical protein